LPRRRPLRDAIGDRVIRDRNEKTTRFDHSRQSIPRADGYCAAASTNQKLFDIAARCSMRNITIGKIRDRESLTGCDSTFLSMSPALRPMKESA
jgi:hypothetical protein